MKPKNLLQKISTGVKIANGAQTVRDISDELSNLDVDYLPWGKRAVAKSKKAVERESEEDDADVPVSDEKPSHLVRNLGIGAGIGAIYLFFSKRNKRVPQQQGTDVSTSIHLTPHFRLSEFLVSSEIPEIKSYKMTQGELRNAVRVATVLEDLREYYGRAIRVTSGGRPAALVARDGAYKGLSLVQILSEKGYSPSAHSQHMDFSAADWTVDRIEDLPNIYQQAIRLGEEKYRDTITQVILYIENGEPRFAHVGVVSDVQQFNIKPENRYLIAKITAVAAADGKKKRDTKFYSYSEDVLNKALA